MSKAPEHFRPFDIEQAKAGAPYGCIDQKNTVEIFKYADHAIFGTIKFKNEPEIAITWKTNGKVAPALDADLVMLPLGMCEGKPVFVGDTLLDEHFPAGYQEFTVMAGVNYDGLSHCKWPRPEPEYPETRITADDICKLGSTLAESNYAECIKLANASIAKAIENGDVVPASMIEKLADAIAGDCDLRMRSSTYTPINLAAIIKRVKEEQ